MIVKLSPQILVQRIDISWNTRYIFLSKELGAPRDNVVKMVTKHPQLLHYSIDNGLLPRINFLRSIGLNDAEIVKVLTSLAQVSFLCFLLLSFSLPCLESILLVQSGKWLK
ncbi:Transcription termination factor MTERF9, chloroplastic [Linum perenne]